MPPPPAALSAPRPSGRGREIAAVCAALAVAVGLSYASSLDVPFQFDDPVVILGEPAITGFHPSHTSRRFLGDLSFALSYRLSGECPRGYHLVNVGIHLANALLVFWLLRSLLRTEGARGALAPGRDTSVAFLAALLFAVHPLQTQAVTYIAQRYASLAAAFFLLACGSYVRFRRSGRGAAAWAWYAAFVAVSGCAFWTKENTLVLPLVVLLIELVWFRASAAQRIAYLSPFLLGAAVAVTAVAGLGPEALDAATRVDTAMPRSDYALTQLRVVAAYLRLLLLPVGQNLDHDVAISRSLLEPAVLVCAGLHAALVAGAVVALARGRRDPLRTLAGFGVLWFYATLLVESSLLPIVDVMFEHRAYLPSVGALGAAAALLGSIPALAPGRRWLAAALALALPLAGLTIARNRVWQSELALWSDAAAKSPHKPRPLNNVGVALFSRGDTRGALDWYDRALRADPSYAKAWFNAGEAHQALGEFPAAIRAYERFLMWWPDYPDTYLNLAQCYERSGQGAAAAQLRAAYERVTRAQGSAPLPPALR